MVDEGRMFDRNSCLVFDFGFFLFGFLVLGFFSILWDDKVSCRYFVSKKESTKEELPSHLFGILKFWHHDLLEKFDTKTTPRAYYPPFSYSHDLIFIPCRAFWKHLNRPIRCCSSCWPLFLVFISSMIRKLKAHSGLQRNKTGRPVLVHPSSSSRLDDKDKNDDHTVFDVALFWEHDLLTRL